MPQKITDFLLYRWRYRVGFLLICALGLTTFSAAVLLAPGGLSKHEMASAVTSTSLSFNSIAPSSIIDLPYHVLQWASIKLFGLTILSVKLPSFILGILVIIGVFGLLRYWYRRNVAIVTTILVIVSGQFIFIAQDGTPTIMLMVWPVWILLAAMMVSRRKSLGAFWKIIMFSMAALSLYTPLSSYILLAIVTAVVFHPHLRYLVRRMTPWKLALATVFAVGLLMPLGYTIYNDPSIAATLLGLPNGTIDLASNFTAVAKQYADFVHPVNSTYMTPIYGLATLLLILIGLAGLVTAKYTARSYITSIWIIMLIPLIILNPSDVSGLFLPIVLLLASGVNFLLRRWYTLFPRNPYARAAGLIPLTILIGAMTFSGVDRFINGYTYSPGLADNFNKDLTLIHNEIKSAKTTPVTLAVKPELKPFYAILSKYNHNVTVVDSLPPRSGVVLVNNGAALLPEENVPARIVTGASRHQGDRLYVYNFSKK